MKRPYDLVALLEQESRVSLLETLKDEMSDQRIDDVDRRYNQIDPLLGDKQNVGGDAELTIEKRLFQNDADCVVAGQFLAEFDLHVSTLIQPDKNAMSDIYPKILKDRYAKIDGAYEEPFCSKVKPLKVDLGNLDQLKVCHYHCMHVHTLFFYCRLHWNY